MLVPSYGLRSFRGFAGIVGISPNASLRTPLYHIAYAAGRSSTSSIVGATCSASKGLITWTSGIGLIGLEVVLTIPVSYEVPSAAILHDGANLARTRDLPIPDFWPIALDDIRHGGDLRAVQNVHIRFVRSLLSFFQSACHAVRGVVEPFAVSLPTRNLLMRILDVVLHSSLGVIVRHA